MPHWSIAIVAGPPRETKGIKQELSKLFDEVHIFDIPDDYGEFPDTSGYTADNWEMLQSELEDGALYSWMTKCMDAALEFTNRRSDTASKLGYRNIEKTVHWPKFGGKVFAVTGHVTAQPPPYLM